MGDLFPEFDSHLSDGVLLGLYAGNEHLADSRFACVSAWLSEIGLRGPSPRFSMSQRLGSDASASEALGSTTCCARVCRSRHVESARSATLGTQVTTCRWSPRQDGTERARVAGDQRSQRSAPVPTDRGSSMRRLSEGDRSRKDVHCDRSHRWAHARHNSTRGVSAQPPPGPIAQRSGPTRRSGPDRTGKSARSAPGSSQSWGGP